MRRSLCTLAILGCFFALVAAWSKEDQEIFRLRDEVETSEGVDVTFYDFLGIKPSASQDDINKAYRKKSRLLHPDKVKQQFIADKSTGKDPKTKSKPKPKNKKPGVHVSKPPSESEIKSATKAASDRFARLGIVTNILRGPERARYDQFLANGFPKWKGTGYYYARFRPGLGSVLAGLFVFVGGGGHWLALYMSWRRQKEFVERYIRFARHAAWGENLGIPGLDGSGSGAATPPVAAGEEGDALAQPVNRRQRRLQEKDAKKGQKTKIVKAARASPAGTPPVNSTGPRKRVVAENGKTLVVDSVGNVFLEQADEDGETQEFLLDPNELSQPTLKDTALYRVPAWAYTRAAGRFLGQSTTTGTTAAAEDDNDDEVDGDGVHTPSSSSDDFEILEKAKTAPAPNGGGKAVRRNKRSSRGGR